MADVTTRRPCINHIKIACALKKQPVHINVARFSSCLPVFNNEIDGNNISI
jgi:hypothetical protein